MKIHELKIFPKYFNEVIKGNKTFELRKNDRDFQVGDILILKEFQLEIRDLTCPEIKIIQERRYTGREVKRQVTYIYHGGSNGLGLRKGFCILALKEVKESEERPY